MSDFFISGMSDSGLPLALTSDAEGRREEFMQHAFLALSQLEFGLMDMQAGKRSTTAAQAVSQAHARRGRISHPEAVQRASQYVPLTGHEHCPHCWVFEGERRALAFRRMTGMETASCSTCATQVQLADRW